MLIDQNDYEELSKYIQNENQMNPYEEILKYETFNKEKHDFKKRSKDIRKKIRKLKDYKVTVIGSYYEKLALLDLIHREDDHKTSDGLIAWKERDGNLFALPIMFDRQNI